MVMETSVSEVSDLACGEQLIWDCSPVIYLCLALPPAVGVSSAVSPACQHPSSWHLVSGCGLSWEETLFWMESGSVSMSCLRH